MQHMHVADTIFHPYHPKLLSQCNPKQRLVARGSSCKSGQPKVDTQSIVNGIAGIEKNRLVDNAWSVLSDSADVQSWATLSKL